MGFKFYRDSIRFIMVLSGIAGVGFCASAVQFVKLGVCTAVLNPDRGVELKRVDSMAHYSYPRPRPNHSSRTPRTPSNTFYRHKLRSQPSPTLWHLLYLAKQDQRCGEDKRLLF
jgi:hypothetical protein